MYVDIDPVYSELELICLDIVNVEPSLRLFIIYRPPNCDSVAEYYLAKLIDCLGHYMITARSNIVMGDFNLPKIDWELINCPEDKIHKSFLTFVVESGLIQFVDFPTRDGNVGY